MAIPANEHKPANGIILIYPKTGLDTAETMSIPLSLLLITAKLVGNPSFAVMLIDQRIDKNWKKKLKERLRSSKPLCVGVSTMTGTQIGFALKAAEIVRHVDPRIPIIWGGVHPTLSAVETIRDELVDIVVVGEGEDTFPELVRALHDHTPLKDVPGIVYKSESGDIITTKERNYANLDVPTDIPYNLVNINNYFYDIVGEKALPMLFSRGCPHRCTFCYRSNQPQPKWRPLSLANILKELGSLIRLGARTVIPLDDNFFVEKERVFDICQLLKEENIHLNFHVNCRIDYADRMSEDELRLLKDAGFISWDFGVESGSQKTLNFMKKDISIDQVLRVNSKLRNLGILPTYSFMGGFLNETYEDLKETIALMFKLISDYPEAQLSPIKIYTPFPNTKMIDELPQSYYRRPSSLRDWAKYDYNTPRIVWHSKKQTRLLEKISFYSYFIDSKRIKTIFGKNVLVRGLLGIYSHVARQRLKREVYSFPIDYLMMKSYYRVRKLF
jgi:anaerobic magnesium-protoporphyrin IX monomethyl ester cyclase